MSNEIPGDPGAPPMSFGITGVARYGSISRVYEEFLRELQGPTGMKLYREQIDNCPITGAFLFAAQFLSRNATFRIDPAGGNIDTQRALEIAQRVKGALFEDLDQTWPDLLSDVLSMFGFGWAVHEVIFKRCHGSNPGDLYNYSLTPQTGPLGQGPLPTANAPSRFNDGWLSFRSLSIRSQETMFMWEWDAWSNAIVLQQLAPPDFGIRRIPLNKCLHFRTMSNKNNPEGRALIRNAVPAYLYKKNIQAIEAIGIERDLAGYPVFQTIPPDPAKGLTPPDLWNTKDGNAVALLARLQTMIRSVKRDEQEGMILPWWIDFKLVSTGSRRQFDTSAVVQRYEKTIALSVLADFIMLGHEAVGSKALASTKSQLFTAALNSLLDAICAIFNRQAIPMLMRLNGIPEELTPTLAHSNVENLPIDALGTFIARLAQAQAPLFPNTDLLEALLDTAHLPTTGISDPEASLSEGPQSGIAPAAPPKGNVEGVRDHPEGADRLHSPSGRLPRMRQPQKTGTSLRQDADLRQRLQKFLNDAPTRAHFDRHVDKTFRPELDRINDQMTRMSTDISSLRTSVELAKNQPAPAPPVVNIHQAPITVKPAPVEIHEAPITINVPPPPVQGPVKKTQIIHRDSAQLITRVETKEVAD